MLNCGMGIVFLLALGVFALIKAEWFRSILDMYPQQGPSVAALLACAALCMTAAMNDISAPSVSLEGKNLWLVQSLPVAPWQALLAKLKLHLFLTEVPTAFCAVCLCLVIRPQSVSAILIVLVPMLFVLLLAAFGLAVNLKTPNLKWTNETVPVKQSLGVMLSMLGGWVFVIALGGLYFAVERFLSAEEYLALCAGVLAALAAALLCWLKKRGSRIFASL